VALTTHPASELENGWFSVEPIDEHTFAISEYGQWMKVHSYLISGEQKAVLVDTGLGVGNIRKIVEQLTPLPVEVVTSHAHWDHTGGHALFERFSVHQAEREWIEGGFDEEAKKIRGYLIREPFTKEPPEEFDLDNYKPTSCPVKHIHQGGDRVELGGRSLRLIHTPGHSPGHVCVYEESSGLLVSADLLYQGVLLAGLRFSNPRDFRDSLIRLRALPRIGQILPGHGRLSVPIDLLDEAIDAFESLDREGLLEKGKGLHEFNRLKVHL
jgi:glyoxylase-like metal-dependent hydrolase (beta-lactamase superfamily II)